MTQLSLLDRQPKPREPRVFHARSHMSPAEVEAGERRALGQQALVVALFRERPGQRMTPSEVWRALGQRWPLTSVRRGLTNLTTAGLLVHHPHERRPGLYGVKESVWGLA